jgi:hypothetical protein
MSPLTSYTKILFSVSLLCGLSVSLFGQGFIDRRIAPFISHTYSNIYNLNDTIYCIGRGLLNEEPFPAKIVSTEYDLTGDLLKYSVFVDNETTNYYPWLQGASKRNGDFIIVSGSGGEGFSNVNQNGFLAKYNYRIDSIEWTLQLPLVYNSSNNVVVESIILPSGNIISLSSDAEGTTNQKFFFRLIKVNSNGEIINEIEFKENDDKWNFVNSMTITNDNKLVIGLQRIIPSESSTLQLWKLDTLGNILDVYETGEDDNGLKCNKIIQSADGGYLFVDRVLESDNGLPHYSSRITKLSANFEKEWDQKVGNIEFRTELFNIKPTNDGNYIAVGISVEENENGIAPAHMIKIDDNGNVLWESFIDVDITLDNGPTAISANSLYDVIELDEGGFIACGQSLGFNVDSFPQQALLIRVDEKGQLNHIFFTPPPNLEPLIVYPNPVQSNLFIKEEEGPLSYEIISIQGSVIRQGIYKNNEGIDISFLTNGLYIVRMENGRKASFMVKK